jgi:hypothetical protein
LAGVVVLGAVVAVAEVVNNDPVSVDVGVGSFGVVGLSVTIVRRLERQPPKGNNGKSGEHSRKPHARVAEEPQGYQHEEEVQHSCGRPQRRERQVEIQRRSRPNREQESDDTRESERNPMSHNAQLVPSANQMLGATRESIADAEVAPGFLTDTARTLASDCERVVGKPYLTGLRKGCP